MHIEVMEKGKQKLMPNEYITVIRRIIYNQRTKQNDYTSRKRINVDQKHTE